MVSSPLPPLPLDLSPTTALRLHSMHLWPRLHALLTSLDQSPQFHRAHLTFQPPDSSLQSISIDHELNATEQPPPISDPFHATALLDFWCHPPISISLLNDCLPSDDQTYLYLPELILSDQSVGSPLQDHLLHFAVEWQ